MDYPVAALLSTIFILYLVFAGAFLPLAGLSAWSKKYDCELLSGEECVWIIAPTSKALAEGDNQ